ncbi:integrase [Paracoccus benzoatiresistens]|uniref:Integrase n=1 Tax=Paracoccus benzoatiresistens TaxID=2997341 RepID=A0ABT4JBZ5_9RHOB|nr:integrase [Paracoccus sp. EF6]MCZ0964434.1 integrase [Paracoccus sp. EF6]
MAGKTRYLLNRNGRFFARLVVPKELRQIVGKSELRTPLGPDLRTAMKHLPGAVAALQHELAVAERQVTASGAVKVQPGRYPLAYNQIAASHYAQRLAFDDLLRNDPLYASISIDDLMVQRLRDGMAGRLNDVNLADLVGAQIERFRHLGNLTAQPGTDEWRQIARALCVAEYEALSRVVERDEGDFTGQPEHPLIVNAQPPVDTPAPVSIKRLWDDYVKSRQLLGSMKDNGRRQALAVNSLTTFLRHDNAVKVAKKDIADWLDYVVTERDPSTVSKVYLPTIRSLFRWAYEKDRIPTDPAVGLRIAAPKKVQNREKGYTTPEAIKVLKASLAYQPKTGSNGKVLEGPRVIAAKRWVPLLCALTGARVAEITQLRKADVRKEGDVHVARITPEAGSTKTGQWRDVPLHRQIIALGFLDYLKSAPDGPLFHNATDPAKFTYYAKKMANRLGEWLQENKLVPEGIQPSHGWRHRLKTIGREVGIQDRVLDAIQGHAPRTAGDNYGDITIKTKADAIERLPDYDLT